MSKKPAASKSKKKSAVQSPTVTSKSGNALPFPPEALGGLFDFLKEKGITEFEWQ